jgi:transcriptional regulator with XRE-family HTH domain
MADTRTDLSQLLRDRREELGLSLRALAAAAVHPETGEAFIKYHRVDRLEKAIEKITPPSEVELRALAAGLRLPLRVLQDAAARQYFGLEPAWSGDHGARALVAHWEEMSDAEKAQLRAIVEAFASSRRRGGETQQ